MGVLVGVGVGVGVEVGVSVGTGVLVGVGVGGALTVHVGMTVPLQKQTLGIGVHVSVRVPLALVEPKVPWWRWVGQKPSVPVSKEPLVMGNVPLMVLLEFPHVVVPHSILVTLVPVTVIL